MSKPALLLLALVLFTACNKDDEIFTMRNVAVVETPAEDTTFTLMLYPNPCDSATTLAVGMPRMSTLKIEFYNLSGQVVYTPNVSLDLVKGVNKFGIETKSLQQGIYFVRCTYDRGSITTKCVVIH